MMRPSLLPELEPYEHLAKLVEVQLDMQFADLWTLLRLPRLDQGLYGGCNLTAATLVFNIVGGASVLFYKSSIEELESRRGRDTRFIRVLRDYYPWRDGEDALVGRQAAKVLYELTRNPLTHSLGVSKHPTAFPGTPRPPGGNAVWVAKRELTAAEVDELVQARAGPPGFLIYPTLTLAGDVYTVHVPTLAWGLHRLMEALFADEAQAGPANETARALLQA